MGVRPEGRGLPGIEGLRATSILVLHTWPYAPPGEGNEARGGLDGFMANRGFEPSRS